MSNHFYHLLASWLPIKEEANWVLGAVIHTRGSVYRKTGSLMLLSDAGHQLGLLSGGCIESDLLLQARKVIALNKSRRVIYDAADDGNIAWRLGIGCGGAAEILLHRCNAQNEFLQLQAVFFHLQQQRACSYSLQIEQARAFFSPCPRKFSQRQHGSVHTHNVLADSASHEKGEEKKVLTTLINPLPHLLILGSGVDVIPLCHLALVLGWRVTLADQRLNVSKRMNFPAGITALTQSVAELESDLLRQVDGVVIAHHNMRLDADAIATLQVRDLVNPYIGLLGPAKRKAEVLAAAGLNEFDLRYAVIGPMGLALGGDLPESIALSVLAECHAHVFGSSAVPLSEMMMQSFAPSGADELNFSTSMRAEQ
jgi:xanthine dehydrogenase accessory factor